LAPDISKWSGPDDPAFWIIQPNLRGILEANPLNP
jgi:hypothetical protein